ncbi:MAG TPA: M56 family metallopeptidase [Pirellulales bacterium]|nr:M56 family metallopeptidase [Pirellulales bacterium]
MNALLLPLTKITAVLATTWLFYWLLAGSNPRWRVLLWRTAGVATIVVLILSVCPPLVTLPLVTRPGRTHVETPVASRATVERRQSPPPESFVVSAMERLSELAEQNEPAKAAPEHRAMVVTSGLADTVRAAADNPRPPFNHALVTSATRAETADEIKTPRSFSPVRFVLAFWSLGVLAASARAAIGLLRLRRIRTDASPVPEWIANEAVRLAGRLGVRRRFTIARTSDVQTPCLAGVWRPVVLMPRSQCKPQHRDELAPILAHELAHLAGNDPQFNALLHGLSIVLWFHPLVWFARHAHADACDEVCDAVAAGSIGDADHYARTLVRLVLRLSEQPNAVGLAMARTSRIQRRVEAVQRRPEIARLRGFHLGLVLMAASTASLICGGLTVSETVAEPPTDASRPADKAQGKSDGASDPAKTSADESADVSQPMGEMVVRATLGETEEPLAGVGLVLNGQVGSERFNRFLVTDLEGVARLNWPAETAVDHLGMTASKHGFVSIHHVWRGEQHKIDMPARLDLRFEPGTQIGGTVQDEEGRPIGGATLDVMMPVTWPRLANYVFTAATLTADPDGKWTWADAPGDLNAVGIGVKHPDYLPGSSTVSPGVRNVSVLRRARQVAGRGVDAQGKSVGGSGPTGKVLLPNGSPAVGAEVGLATQSKRAFLKLGMFDRPQNQAEVIKTDADGRFAFLPQQEEPFLLLIVHEAGFAERHGSEFNPDEPIVLEAWGRIEGLVLVGTKPDANSKVTFLPDRPPSRRTFPYVFAYDYTTDSDEGGRFSFDRVIPGSGSVCRVVVKPFLDACQYTCGWQTPVEIQPANMAKVVVGGRGRPVIGSVTLRGGAEVMADWTTNELARIEAWDKETNQRAEPAARFTASLDKSGRFVIPDVPAGDYRLTVPVSSPPTPNAYGPGKAIGRAVREFTVSGLPGCGRSDEPLDLGVLEAELFDTLVAGDTAPEFVVEPTRSVNNPGYAFK